MVKENNVSAVVSISVPKSVLAAGKLDLLERLIEGLQPAELYGLAAWIAGQPGRIGGGAVTIESHKDAATETRLTILFGSQTGNARRIAEGIAERGMDLGIRLRLMRADVYPTRELLNERYLVIVISTQGEGEPPDDARGLVEFVTGKRAPKLPHLQFAVLGLGDSSYPQFCAVGRQLDVRLEKLGATRLNDSGEVDVDPEGIADPWIDKVLEKLRKELKSPPPTLRLIPEPRTGVVPASWSRKHPFSASVLSNQRIVARDSEREVRHVELDLQGSGIRYRPGDALGVCPVNPPALVEQWLDALVLDGTQPVTFDGRTLLLNEWLGRERDLTRLYRSWIEVHARLARNEELDNLLQPGQRQILAGVLESDQPIDLLRRYPAKWSALDLVAALRPLQPRLYSIASSQLEVGDEVHLSVAIVAYKRSGEPRWGAASSFLAGAAVDRQIPVFIEPNERFRLPLDPVRDVIMIGPGTGVAPFRGFLQERQQMSASGRNWLIFGNRHFQRDFLYQTEWQAALKKGALYRLDLAFSRDTCKRIYVQQRMREQGRDLYAWLQKGASLYVCGDAKHMAVDVHEALTEIVSTHGNISVGEARTWLSDLMQQGRYVRDVY